MSPEPCTITPGCRWPRHAAADHPCGDGPHIPGSPCRYCTKPTPADGQPCPDCWTPIPATLADAKATFAAIGLSLAAVVGGPGNDNTEGTGDE